MSRGNRSTTHANESISGTSVCRSTATANAGIGFTFTSFWNGVCRIQRFRSGSGKSQARKRITLFKGI